MNHSGKDGPVYAVSSGQDRISAKQFFYDGIAARIRETEREESLPEMICVLR